MEVRHVLRQEFEQWLETFLPLACPWCGRLLASGAAKTDLCRACLEGILAAGGNRCPRCSRPHATLSASHHHCEPCLRTPPAFEKVHLVGLYQGSLKQAIHTFKYRDDPALAASLGRMLADRLSEALDDFQPERIIPVPLHASRLRRRGYNQALELAKPVARILRVPLAAKLLERVRPTLPQQGLEARARQTNLHQAFALRTPLDNADVLLVDDVMTTGATARECSLALRRGGAGRIRIAVLGRA